MSRAQAAAPLGVSERTFGCWRGRQAAEGAGGSASYRRDVRQGRAAADAERYHEHSGFAIRHFHDRLRQRHG